MLKTPGVRTILGGSDVVSRGRRKGLWTLSKVSKTWGVCSISKNDGRRGTFDEDLERCIFRGMHSTRDMFIRAVRRCGRWFPEKMQHVVWPGITFFRGRRSSLDRWTGKIAKHIIFFYFRTIKNTEYLIEKNYWWHTASYADLHNFALTSVTSWMRSAPSRFF